MAVKFKNSININDQYTLPSTVGLTNQYLKVNDAATGELVFADLGEAAQVSTIAYEVRNETGVSIPKGSVVYVSGGSGSSDHVTIALSSASSEATSSKTFGITAETIANNSTGDVVLEGLIEGLDTSAFTSGSTLWLGDTPGSIQGYPPPSTPSHAVFVGYAVRAQQNNGSLFVKIQNGYELEELHDVLIESASEGDLLAYDATNGYWKNISAEDAIQASLTIEKNEFVGDGVEVDFIIDSAVIAESRTQVYIDGVYQSKSNYSTSSQTITFSEAPADGANIEVIHITTLSANITVDNFTADGTQSQYELSNAISAENNIQVYFDGVYQSKGNFSVSGSTITFSENVENGVDIEVVHLQPSVSQNIAFSGQVILYGGIADAYGGSGDPGQILSSSVLGIEWIDAPDLDGEIANRIAADSTLQDNIDAEGAARIAADTVLQDNIDAEATTRASEDATLLSTINAEAVIRGTNDNTLQSNIDSEETARISADNTLQDNINIEAQSRASADAALQSSIDTINAKDIVLTINGDASGSTTFTNLTNATLTLAIIDDSHNHVISNIDGLQAALDLKANITYVDTAVANLVDSSPSTLNTLNELAAALGDDPNFATTVSTQIGTAQSTANTALTNANAALAKDPTLTISGDASGSATFTNLGNATLSLTIADDSHNHIISNIDGLQAALDGKQAAGTYNTIIGTDTDINTSGATIVDNIYVTDGVITSMGTRTLTLGDLGYTGATNANYITNNNQLTNGAGYLTNLSSQTISYVFRINTADGTSPDNFGYNSRYQTFNYGVSSGVVGPLMSFGGLGDGYPMQITGAYSGGGNAFKVRTRNGDTATWNSWRTLITDGNISTQSVSYSATSGDANLLDGLNSTQFLRSDTNDTMSGNLDVNGTGQFNSLLNVVGVDPGNPAAGTDQIRLSGYGMLGNRGALYITNPGGDVQIGAGTVHGQSPSAAFNGSNINLYRNTTVSGSLFAPIFYDSNNTTYFVDPAVVSNLNQAKFLAGISVNSGAGSGTKHGISLYGTQTTGMPSYGLAFTGTAGEGTHGSVTSDWATYFTMAGSTSRGWIFKHTTNRVASISGTGTATFNGDVVAFFSDMRLKTKLGNIKNPIDKIKSLNGFYYEPNEVAESYGYKKEKRVGLSAQEVEAVLPEIVTEAPIGDGYKTVDYAKLVPVLVEAIKEQQTQIDELKQLINKQ